MTQDPSPAMALAWVQQCLRQKWDPAAAGAAARLAGLPGFDWPAALALAEAESLSPLLYDRLRGADDMPGEVLAVLKEGYFRTASRNILLRRDRDFLLAAWSRGGIPVIVLKGAALVDSVYRNPALRPMGDLDFLIRPEDVAGACRVADALGYRPVHVEARAGMAAEFESELALLKAESAFPVMVELHWSLIDSPYYRTHLAIDWYWDTALQADLGGQPALLLAPAAEILYLCAHQVLHHGAQQSGKLLWDHDVAELIAATPDRIDWSALLAAARRDDLVLPLQEVLGRLLAAGPLPVPYAFLRELAALAPSAAEERVYRWLTAPVRPARQRLWADLHSLPTWPARIAFAWHNLFPSTQYMRHRYGARHSLLLPLYYPYRWLLGLAGRR